MIDAFRFAPEAADKINVPGIVITLTGLLQQGPGTTPILGCNHSAHGPRPRGTIFLAREYLKQ
jgi:hypothetical protein